MADTLQEYPVFGTSDYKDGGLSVFEENTPLYLDFQYEKYEIINGKKRIKGFPSTYADENESQTLIIFMKDKNYNITLEQRYTIRCVELQVIIKILLLHLSIKMRH